MGAERRRIDEGLTPVYTFLHIENSRNPTPYALARLKVASPPIAKNTAFVASPVTNIYSPL